MSVPMLNRSLSGMQYLTDLGEVQKWIWNKEDQIPKRQRFKFHEAITKPIINAYIEGKAVNSTYVTDSQSYCIRRNHLKECYNYTQAVAGELSLLATMKNGQLVSVKEIEKYGVMLNDILKMIKGVEKKDAENYKKLKK